MNATSAEDFLRTIWTGLGGNESDPSVIRQTGSGDLASAFAVSDLAVASVAAAGLAAAELVSIRCGDLPGVQVDRRLASLWFSRTLAPRGWSLPPIWDPIAGDYAAKDGWIRLHTNAPHHRDAALAVLGTANEKPAVAAAVSRWTADDLETAVVARGGCAAAMRSLAAWADHPQGRSVAAESLLSIEDTDASPRRHLPGSRERPLAGVRVLDLTRVLAGPVATRFLAGLGADVLRIDPPWWDEPSIVPDVALGKRCARLDLRLPEDRRRLADLIAEADVLVHGYRPGALTGLGLDAQALRRLSPGLVDVSLDAYGWTGPWRGRRGFDSLVQMSAGIAAEGMRRFGTDQPKPLPVQALDHAAGYFMAATAIRGLTRRVTAGVGSEARTSLARMASLLTSVPAPDQEWQLGEAGPADYGDVPEATGWGPALRLRPPLAIDGVTFAWDRPAPKLGSSPPRW